MSEVDELLAHARDTHVVVVGGGVAGLVAAMSCAKVGFAVTLVEAADRLGGTVRPAHVAGLTVDTGADGFSLRAGIMPGLLTELGLAGDHVQPRVAAQWLAGVPGVPGAPPLPLPADGVLGIPANPFADDVRRILGTRGAWRAYLDRLRPPLTVGREQSLGRLVRTRMGERVLERLVAPIAQGRYLADPDLIDVDAAAPGLSAALTRAGSLSGAVAAQPEGGAGAGLVGGMSRLVDALAHGLDAYGVQVRLGTAASALEPGDDGGWIVRVVASGADAAGAVSAGDPAGGAGAADAAYDSIGDASGDPADTAIPADATGGPRDALALADAVILAVPDSAARRLLAPHLPALGSLASPAGCAVETVVLVLDAPALDGAPRGAGVLTVPGSHRAVALTHATAQWDWLAAAAAGRHVVRVSFGAPGRPPATAGLDDDAAAQLALAEARLLLGLPLGADALVAAHRERFTAAAPGSVIGHAGAARDLRAAIHAVPGIGATGAWLAGSGLANVVADAAAEAERVRRAALWG